MSECLSSFGFECNKTILHAFPARDTENKFALSLLTNVETEKSNYHNKKNSHRSKTINGPFINAIYKVSKRETCSMKPETFFIPFTTRFPASIFKTPAGIDFRAIRP